MRKRNNTILLRISDAEKKMLVKKCEQANMNYSQFLRDCIAGKQIKPAPTKDYMTLYKEINHIGNNINQATKSVNMGIATNEDIVFLKDKLNKVYEILEAAL